MPDRFLHIAYLPGDDWVLPILARLQTSSSAALRARRDGWQPTEIGLAIATKCRLLPIVSRRLDESVRRLGEHLTREGELERLTAERRAYLLPDSELPFELVLDLDSFLFEFRSTYEMLLRFVVQFFRRVLQVHLDEAGLKVRISERGFDASWLDRLKEIRNFFSHEAAPWIGVHFLSEDLKSFELIVLRRNIVDLGAADPADFVRFDALREIYNGLPGLLTELRDWLLEEIAAYELSDPASPPDG